MTRLSSRFQIPETPRLVCFTGPMGSGKSSAAAALVLQGWELVKFASPLKKMLRVLYLSAGLTAEEVEDRIEGNRKDRPDVLLGGRTPRHAMQSLGTEWGREMIDPDLWAAVWAGRVSKALERGRRVVCDDLRFPNELSAARFVDPDAVIVELTGRRRHVEAAAAHASENGVLADWHLLNTGTETELRERVRAFDFSRGPAT